MIFKCYFGHSTQVALQGIEEQFAKNKKMRIHTISDLHMDYEENYEWLKALSSADYKNDVLIVAGDVSDISARLIKTFNILSQKFYRVLFVPGNHDLWVLRNNMKCSLQNYKEITRLAADYGVSMKPLHLGSLSIIPLLGWYDYSFGMPSRELRSTWMDYSACKWPENFNESTITNYFVSKNEEHLGIENQFVISFSHFLPRIDLMPFYIPQSKRILYPVLGSSLLELQIRKLKPQIHIYGHSHINANVNKENITYINNAYGYPNEVLIAAKKLLCVYEM